MLSNIDKLRAAAKVRKKDFVTPLSASKIEEMVQRRADLDFQLQLVRKSMARHEILPYPFDRAVTLLVKAKRFDEALEIARYVEYWCCDAEQRWQGGCAKVWLSPKLIKIIERIPKLKNSQFR